MTTHQSIVPADGVENPSVLDLITHDPASDEVILVMIETRPWNQGEKQLFQIQEKINSYLSFILDGEMGEAYPEYTNKPVCLRLDCPEYPNDPVIDFFDHVQEQLAKQKISFLLRVIEKNPGSSSNGSCGNSHCGCH